MKLWCCVSGEYNKIILVLPIELIMQTSDPKKYQSFEIVYGG